MQYYQSPQNSSEDSILKSIEVLSRYVDEIAEFRLIGGEPLMNRQWHTIAKTLLIDIQINRFLYTPTEL